jgi:putative flippase GtrA
MIITLKKFSEDLVKDQTDRTKIQLFRYIFGGGVAFAVDFISLFVLTNYLGIYYLISAAIAFTLGLLLNYILSVKWVFNRRTIENRTFEFGIFAFIGIVGLGLNEVFIWFFTQDLQIYYLISKILASIIILFWNFFARKFILFR